MRSRWLGAVSSALAGARFFARLPLDLLRPLSESDARARLAARLRERNDRFLDRLRKDVFARPRGVYAELFRHAGCEYGDIEPVVRASGVEAALETLFRAGVYITVDEFKGRAPIVRGRLTLAAEPDSFRSPRAAYHLPASSGGSRSGGTPVLFDLRFVRDCAANRAISFHARAGADWVKAAWETPGGGARLTLIMFAAFGAVPKAWFSQMDPADLLVPASARWSMTAMRLAGALAGRPFPAPQDAPLSDAKPVVDWAAQTLAAGRVPLLHTFPSSAVRACLTASEQGVSIAGTVFQIVGEPITDACISTIRSAGATAIPLYGSMETASIGYGCLDPVHSDDIHLLDDMLGLIQAGAAGPAAGLPEKAIFVTCLHPRSPFLLLNASMGDAAELSDRACGCGLQQAGWQRHLHNIRSYEKLNAHGVTFLAAEILPVLERILPSRLGGAPTNYQLVETESADGQPRVELRVDPKVGEIPDETIMDEFCAALEGVSRPAAQRIRLWRDAGTLAIVRRPPLASRAGKILHVHRQWGRS